MGKHKKISKRKTRRTRHSVPSKRGKNRRIIWTVAFVFLLCAGIVALLVVRYVWQRNQQEAAIPPSLSSRESLIQPLVNPSLPVEQQIASLKSSEMELAEKVVRDFPNSGEAYILMGNLHRRLGSSAKAIEFWQKGLELSPKRADVYQSLGIVAMERGDFEQAISSWQKVLEINPRMPGVHNSIARALMGLGRQDEAIKELQEDVRVSPDAADSHFLLGQAFLQQQDYDKAKMYYEKTIELQPDHLNAYYGLSTACARLKQSDKAKEYRAIFTKLRADTREERKYGHSPSNDLARIRQGMAGLSMQAAKLYQASGEIGRAEQLLTTAIAVDPNNAAPHQRLAVLYRATNRIPAALAQCEKVRQLEPNDPACHLLIAILALQLKRADRAETAFRDFTVLCPNQSVGYRELAQLYIRTNRKLDEAKKLAKKAVELESTAENYYILGWACQRTKDKQAALAAIQKAIELAPNNREYRKMYDLIRYGK